MDLQVSCYIRFLSLSASNICSVDEHATLKALCEETCKTLNGLISSLRRERQASSLKPQALLHVSFPTRLKHPTRAEHKNDRQSPPDRKPSEIDAIGLQEAYALSATERVEKIN
jgi:hypothetical protein